MLICHSTLSIAQEHVQFDLETWRHKMNREEYAKIFTGNTKTAIENMIAYKKEHPEIVEDLYGLSVAYYAEKNNPKGMQFFKQAVTGGVPVERFMAGPRKILKPLYQSKEFNKLIENRELIHGPMTGAVTKNSAKVWVRTFHEKNFSVKVAENKELANIIGIFSGQTLANADYTGVAEISELQPNTCYFYSVTINGVPVGNVTSFKTFPEEKDSTILRIAFGGGAFYNPKLEYIWNVIAKQKPNFFLGMGDNVYIDHPKIPEVQKFCYYQRQSSKPFIEMLKTVPYYSVWDDHDFGVNDSYGGAEKHKPAWKDNVLKVYKENTLNPYYGGGEENPGTWYNFKMGNVAFFMIDTRYYRTPSFVENNGANANMLGKIQMEWLKKELKKSTAIFKVIVSSIPWSDGAKDIMEGRFDTWRGYPKERTEIFNFLTKNKIEGVVLFSADRHRHDAWKHKRPGDYSLYEFTSSRLTNIHYHELRKGALFGYNQNCGFGVVEFNTAAKQPYLVFKIINIDNELIDQIRVYLHQLQMPVTKE
jgi:alkaline phosphatase D